MVCFGLYGVLFVFIAECELKRRITIRIFCFNLGYRAGASFNDGAGSLPSISAEDAGHPDLFSNNSFHFFAVLAPQVVRTFPLHRDFNPLFATDLFFCFPESVREEKYRK
jgi:hypothetical protein